MKVQWPHAATEFEVQLYLHLACMMEQPFEASISFQRFHVPCDAQNQQGSHYNDFHTIDWQRDIARDRMRHRYIMKRKFMSVGSYLWSIFDAWSGWLCVFILGVVAGATASIMDIGVNWMSNIREGVCTGAFWFNKEQCCWASPHVKYKYDNCPEWKEWAVLFGLPYDNKYVYGVQYVMYIIASAFLAVLCASLVRSFAPYAVGSGITEIKTILSGFIMRGFLGKWTYIIKSTCVMLAVSSGLSVGQEGPMIHIACCLGNIVSGLFPKYGKNEAKKREMLSAAAAAGVSIAFGAPIGGVLFSLEEISYYFPMKTMWRSFFCALVAAFTVRSINPFGNDHSVLFYVDYDTPWAYAELVPFLILGALGGIIGAVFIKVNIMWCRYRKTSQLGKYPITEVLGVCILTAILTYPNPFTRMNSSEMILMLFSDCGPADNALCVYARNYTSLNPPTYVETGLQVYNSVTLLLLALLAKIILTLLAFGIKVPAGLIIPSLAIGSVLGRLFGIGMEELVFNWPQVLLMKDCRRTCVTPGLYAVVGAAAVLGGVSRMTVSLVVIMFEITGGINTIMPVMLATMSSKWIGDALCNGSIYDAHIKLNNYPFLHNNNEELEQTSVASDIMQPRYGSPRTLQLDGMSLGELKEALSETEYSGFPVVVSNVSQYLVGFVWRTDIVLSILCAERVNSGLTDDILIDMRFPSCSSNILPDAPPLSLGNIVDLAPITITVQTPLETVIEMFTKLGLRQILVTNNGLLVGIITRKDVLSHLHSN